MSFSRLADNPAAAYIWRANGPHGTGYQFYASNYPYTEPGGQQRGFSLVFSVNPLTIEDSKQPYAHTAYHKAGIVERVVMAPFSGQTALGYSLLSVGYDKAGDAVLEGINRRGTPIAVAAAMEAPEAEELFTQFRGDPTKARDYASYLLLEVLGTGHFRSSHESSFEGFDKVHFGTAAKQSPHEGFTVSI